VTKEIPLKMGERLKIVHHQNDPHGAILRGTFPV
jgi:hypothetical protein